ncbi:Dcp1-like decapping protein [Encephalitozoon intestinalis ATCC 50506]|uniref:Dcp1-like decapping protein n=1 Tax=Encephalitozoon intestinalis (strain ATCC 50506) TaxID=876142 RepID=E0SAF9_ENCIT|nr:Dcp1-like decapping protein [Encephalitozoon intestinalis ATCC 50506]ADM12584.1 Dcp1-like decapping protein [Encephalitozoon intestinalis ATCC 50506]UTX46441.1 Dcp1-like decapping protein [Encephalitozoon intestinalis]
MLGEKEGKILMREVRKTDQSLRDLLYVSNFVSVYYYTDGNWDKAGIEGTFVMYSRECYPLVGIHVFNRKDLKDFSLYLSKELSFGIKGNLMTITEQEENRIHGLWFHNDVHPKAILECLESSL